MAYRPGSILSSNTKTGVSLNLPIKGHCRPTKNCSRCCYAKSGHTTLPSSLRKQTWLSKYLAGKDISELIHESRLHTAVRISGTGDLSLEHIPNILLLAKSCPGTMFWGMTRKIEIAKALDKVKNIKLMVSLDSSSPEETKKYKGAICWGPNLPGDKVPDRKNIITVFPYHRSGHVIKGVPRHPKDCLAVHHEIPGCLSCNRCWSWK